MSAPARSEDLDQLAGRVLRRLREPGGVLVVARDVRLAAVFVVPPGTPVEHGNPRPLATLRLTDVAAMLAAGWIVRRKTNGEVAQFGITKAGRAHLDTLTGAGHKLVTGKAPTFANLLRWSRDRARRRVGVIR